MEKKAGLPRKRSPDTLQQHLRERKRQWNNISKKFIPKFLAFKQSLNGHEQPVFGLPASNIKDPLPPELGAFLEQLAGEFSWLVGEAHTIVQEQTDYSTRRRKTQKQSNVEEIDLIKDASNPISRFLSRFKSVFQSDKFTGYRLSALSMATRLFKNLVALEDIILAKGTENTPEIINTFYLVSNNVETLDLIIQKMENIVQPIPSGITPTDLPTSSKPIESEQPESEQPEITVEVPTSSKSQKPSKNKIVPSTSTPAVQKNIPDLENISDMLIQLSPLGITPDLLHSYNSIIKSYKSAPSDKKGIIADRAQERLAEILVILSGRIKKKFNIEINPEADISEFLILADNIKKRAQAIDELKVEASNLLTRWLKKYRHQLSKADPTSAARLEIYGFIRSAKIIVDKIMDSLEDKSVDPKELSKQIIEVENLLSKIEAPLGMLKFMYKDIYFKKKEKGERLDPASLYYNREMRRRDNRRG